MKLISLLALATKIWAHGDHSHDEPADDENSKVVVLTDGMN
jgi:hypothetical protein